MGIRGPGAHSLTTKAGDTPPRPGPRASFAPWVTVKQAAESQNMSERKMAMLRAVARHRPDLAEAVEKREMTVNAAYRITMGKPEETRWDRLCAAWNACTEEERIEFFRQVEEASD